jgi:hypothetical protein
LRRLKLDWSVIDCRPKKDLLKTEKEVRRLRQNLEKDTDKVFDEYDRAQRRAWEKASNLFLD